MLKKFELGNCLMVYSQSRMRLNAELKSSLSPVNFTILILISKDINIFIPVERCCDRFKFLSWKNQEKLIKMFVLY